MEIDHFEERISGYAMPPQKTSHLTKNNPYTVRVLTLSEFTPHLIAAWEELEERAIVPNAFLSPHFVIPALRYLESSDNTFGAFVEKASGGLPDLMGVALFQVRKPTRQFPLKHLAAYASIHSYLSDFLIDRDHAPDALKEIYGYLTAKRHAWHGLSLSNVSAEGLFTEQSLAIAADFGMKWHLSEHWSRAVLFPKQLRHDPLAHLSKRQKKNYHRNQRKLQELGHLEWTFKPGTTPMQESIEAFLRLEHMGWKGEQGTSLSSNPHHARFFREMMTRFNEKGRAFFSELSLNDKIIASTSNFISGRAGFGFKVGWDSAYAKYGPGTVNEIKIMEECHHLLANLEYMDSSAGADSFMNSLWPARREIYEGMFSLTPTGQAVIAGLNAARKLKNALLRRNHKTPRQDSEDSSSVHSESAS